MCRIAFDIPNEILLSTRQSEAEAVKFVRKYAALNYYVQGGVSLGYAAQIADMDKESFIKFLGENKVSIFHYDSKEEFLEELKNG